LKAASIFIVAIPMLILYPFIQRFFIKGIMLGAVKQ
jgi:putative aldouronate transport system permease protein